MPTSVEEWIAALRRHILVSAFAFAAVIAITVVVILYAPRSYRSEAKVMLRIGRESVTLDPTASTVGDTISLHHTRANEIQSELGVMRSREILESVVDRIGQEIVLKGRLPRGFDQIGGAAPKIGPAAAMESETMQVSHEEPQLLPLGVDSPEASVFEDEEGWYAKSWIAKAIGSVRETIDQIDPVEPREKSLYALSNAIHVQAPTDSSVVSVFYESKSPEVAQMVVDAWTDAYLLQHARVNRTEGSLRFFVEQGARLQEQLDAARISLEAAKNASNLVTIDGQQRMLESQLSSVRASLIEVESEIASLGSRTEQYEQVIEQMDLTVKASVSGVANQGKELMRKELFLLEVEQKDLQSKFRQGHPKLVAIERQLAEARKVVEDQNEVREQVTESINPSLMEMVQTKTMDQVVLSGLIEKRKSLLEKQADLAEEVAQLNKHERTIAMWTNEVKILEERYANHADKLEQARLDEVLSEQQISSVSVVQPASLERRPTSPNKPLCAAAGLLAAFSLALGLPVLMEFRSAAARSRNSMRAGAGDGRVRVSPDAQDDVSVADRSEFESQQTDGSANQEPLHPVASPYLPGQGGGIHPSLSEPADAITSLHRSNAK